ncbi:MAG: hypothetical protein ABI689_08305 [Thermoanaerobaculia bacterium]
MTNHTRNRKVAAAVVLILGLAAVAVALSYHYAGTIASGPQYDTYVIPLSVGTHVTADTYCAAPPNNTLDTILTAFAPGVDPSDTANAAFYNDDGGADICGGFRNSRLEFDATVAGNWTFRVDGFGSATGDYTLDILTQSLVEVPTLDSVGLVVLTLVLAGIALVVLRRRRTA